MLYTEMSALAQAAFAGIDQAAQQAELMRNVGDLPGGFAKKTVGNRLYWYYQWKTATGKLRQSYVGPDDAKTQALMTLQAGKVSSQDALRAQARSAIEMGCQAIPPKHAKSSASCFITGFSRRTGCLWARTPSSPTKTSLASPGRMRR